jgi:hypothetical protein
VTGGRPARGHLRADAAVDTLGALLDALRAAMVAGDLPALEDVRARIQGVLSDPAWRRDAACGADPARLREALALAGVGAGLAARGESHAARALATLAPAPSLYTASGALGARGGGSRGVAA